MYRIVFVFRICMHVYGSWVSTSPPLLSLEEYQEEEEECKDVNNSFTLKGGIK